MNRFKIPAMLLAGTMLGTTPAHAQVTPAPVVPSAEAPAPQTTAPPQSTSQADGIQDIVVTASRISDTSQRTALALDVIQPEALTQVTQPQDLTKLAPAAQIGNAGGASPLLYVRGVGTFSSNAITDSAVAVNYDEIYLGRPTSSFGLYYDLARIELLKGPQGTLYGRNATGGALNIIPATPKLGLHEGSATISTGNYQAVNAQAYVNLPLSDKAALRVSGISYSHDGYNSDDTYTEKGTGGRVQLLFQPDDRVTIRLAGDFFHLGGTGPTGTLLSATNPQTGALIPTGFSPDVGLFDPRSVAFLNSAFVPTAGTVAGPVTRRPSLDNIFYGASAHVDADLGFAQLAVVGGWRGAEQEVVQTPGAFFLQNSEKDEQYSIEARLNGTVGAFDWLLGGLYFTEDIDDLLRVNFNVLGSSGAFKAKNESTAAFGRIVWNITDTFRASGAARYTKDVKTIAGTTTTATGICTAPSHVCPNFRRLPATIDDLPAALLSIGYVQPPGVPVYVDVTGQSNAIYSPSVIPLDARTAPDKVTYRGAVEFEPRSGSLLYASVETGYRSGGFSFSTVQPVFGPETITAYTIGAKNRFLNNRLQLNVEGFYWKYKDQQVTHNGIGTNGGLEFVTENIGSSTNKGVEVDLTAKPFRNTLLSANVQYLDARNDSFVYTEVDTSSLGGLPAGTVPPATRCPYQIVAGNRYRIDCSGTRALRSPEWTINLGAQQTFEVSDDLRLTLEGNTHYQTSNIVMFERRDFSVQPAYWVTDLAVTLSAADDQWSLAGFVNNVGDERFFTTTYYSSLNGITQGNYSPPRTYGARFSFRY
ncbi:TonB-dependent receptor [Sphingomonas adhaesiva]|uniref:TonB-dependent receptor n=1 Tax=Sphingomonas adhaesiva TaxID=28212 RepID=UPI002FF7FBDA